MAKLQCSLNHITCKVPSGIIVEYNHQVFHRFIVKIELAHFHKMKLFSTLGYSLNKRNNIIELANWVFFSLKLKLFLDIWNSGNSIDFCSENLFVFPVQKSLRS